MKIIRPVRSGVIKHPVKEKEWSVRKGDFIMTTSKKPSQRKITCAKIGVFSDFEGDKVIFERDYRISFHILGGQKIPVMADLSRSPLRDTSLTYLEDIVVGPENIANKLREMDPAYEPYAALVERMRPPYL